MKREDRYQIIVDYFSRNQPDAETELQFSTPYELLVAVVLSAQCTDKRVNLITPALFRRFPDAEALAQGSVDEIFSYIRSVSYPNNKAKHLAGLDKCSGISTILKYLHRLMSCRNCPELGAKLRMS